MIIWQYESSAHMAATAARENPWIARVDTCASSRLLLRVRHYWWRVHWVHDITGWKADEVEYEGLRSLSISAALLFSKSHCILIALTGRQRVARILPFIGLLCYPSSVFFDFYPTLTHDRVEPWPVNKAGGSGLGRVVRLVSCIN